MATHLQSGLFVLAMLLPHAGFAQEAGRDPARTPHQHASSPAGTPLPSPLSVPVDPAILATLPRESMIVARAQGKPLRCEGFSLAALLARAGVFDGEPLGDERLASYVLVAAQEGRRVLYSLAELAPAAGNDPVFLVDRCDGQPLDAGHGPLQLVAPHEARNARWLRKVKSITVVAAP